MATLFPLIICLIAAASSAGCDRLNQAESTQSLSARQALTISETPAVIASIGAAGREFSPALSADDPGQIYFVDKVVFSENGTGAACKLLTGKDQWSVLVNGSQGPVYDAIGDISLSRDGRRYAYKAQIGSKWCLISDGSQKECHDDINSLAFTRDNKQLLVEYLEGGRYFLSLSGRISGGSSSFHRTPRFSADMSRILYIDSIVNDDAGRLVLSSTDFRTARTIGGTVSDFTLNFSLSAGAAIELTGPKRQSVFRFNPDGSGRPVYGPEFDLVTDLTFFNSEEDLFYFGRRDKNIIGVLNGKEETLPEGLKPSQVVLNRAKHRIGMLAERGGKVALYEMFGPAPGRISSAEYESADSLEYSPDGSTYAFAAYQNGYWFLVTTGGQGPQFERVVSPEFSPDGKFLAYRARSAGKRFVVVADAKTGRTLRQHPMYDQVFDVKFIRGGSSVAYGVKDGRDLVWKVVPL